MPTEKPELKSCPFCGAIPQSVEWSKLTNYYVRCEADDCTTNPETNCLSSEAEAIAAWNQRAEKE